MSPADEKSPTPHRPDLRKRAEELLRTTRTDLAAMPDEDVQRLVQELQVHQIELELQNEELREAQVELAESRDRYSDLYEFAPVAYLSLDRDGTIREANLTAATMLGTERGELPGTKVSAYVARESQDDFYLHRREVFSSETKEVCEIGMRTAGGKLMAVRMECVAYGPEDDRCCRTALIDVTAQKEAEMALHMLNIDLGQSLEDNMSELRDRLGEVRLLSEAVSKLGEGVMIIGSGLDWPETEILFVNDAMCRITGYTRNELFGQTPSVLHGVATDREALERTMAELSAGRPCLVELTNYRKDGSPYEVGLFITPLLDSEGRRANFVMIHRDISDRKRSERVLRKSEERLRAIMDATPDAIITIDREGMIVAANSSAERIFGYDAEELPGQNVAALIPTFQGDRSEGSHERLRRIGDGESIGLGREVTGCRKDGSSFDADLSLREVRRLGLFIGVIRDVTNRKLLEGEVIKVAEEERQRIAHDLHDDLGSLLTGIKLATEAHAGAMARAGSGDAGKCRTIAQQVAEALVKTRNIARGLRPVGSDPEDLMDALRELCRQTEESTDFECRCDCPDPVVFDEPVVANHLFRIAQEAVNNAVKHSGGTGITISLRNQDGAVELKVDDDGSGFDRSGDQGGGLGLHIMHYRAHAVNASLRIEQRVGGGTSVVCIVPLVAPTEDGR